MADGKSYIAGVLSESAMQREKEIAELKAIKNAKPFVVPLLEQSFTSTYDLCVAPLEALKLLNLGSHDLAVIQMQRELKSGRIKAVCDEAIMFVDGQKTNQKFAVIGSWFWYLTYPDSDLDFWKTGYVQSLLPANIGQTEWQGDIEFFGVRFSPVNLPGFNQSNDDEIATDDENEKPTVSKSDLGKWYQVFLGVHEQASEALALQSAQSMFPDKSVPRQMVRDLRGPQKRGKPVNRRE